jgi:hypothetical protein
MPGDGGGLKEGTLPKARHVGLDRAFVRVPQALKWGKFGSVVVFGLDIRICGGTFGSVGVRTVNIRICGGTAKVRICGGTHCKYSDLWGYC